MNSQVIKILLTVVSLTVLINCGSNKKRILNFPKTDLVTESMIPAPLEVRSTHGGFALDQYTAIVTDGDIDGFEGVSNFLAKKINETIGLLIPVNSKEGREQKSVIYIKSITEGTKVNQSEAYQLSIKPDSIILSATTAAGAFRGIQTLRQIIPERSNDSIAEYKIWAIPTGIINDRPAFEYRGAMLDVARHFFSVDDVKKYIDLLAYYKYNAFHMHLSDDQGWRIEIKSWPKLTEIGAQTEIGEEPGGFYTQEEYKEIVGYALERYITIIPEIDMPGHTNAASLSYPFLNGNGKTPKIYKGTNVGFSTFDTRKDTVYSFIDDVVREISTLTPGPYFHIGGDESKVTKKEDFNYFIAKVQKIVSKYDKRMIGWDEIINADIDTSAVVQFWQSKENAQQAVKKNRKIILSPAVKTYMDMKYDAKTKIGYRWAALIPVDSAYNWTPENYEGIPVESVLGIEAPLWTETVTNIDELEYLAFPRAIGYAELSWSMPENRNWENYKIRLAKQTRYLDRMEVNYYQSPLIDWEKKY